MAERLSAHAEGIGARTVRDGAFSSVGFVVHHHPSMLTYLESTRWLPDLAGHHTVVAVITTEALAESVPTSLALAVADDPKRAFYDLHERLMRETSFYGAGMPTRISPSATVDSRAAIAPENITIGARAVIQPFVVLRGRVIIEDDAIVGAGSVIGSDGFQVLVSAEGSSRRIRHGGVVRVAKGAEIRAHCCIDRALFGGETRIGEDSTLDHFVYVAHDVRFGARCRVGAGAIINGSVAVGDDVWIGPGATLRDGITIGHGAKVSLGSVVTRDVPQNQRVSGNFAVPHDRLIEWLRRIR
jgi:UDP-3-O-[3-hydroxymyristoyl] glucosamine N-acyltransferase